MPRDAADVGSRGTARGSTGRSRRRDRCGTGPVAATTRAPRHARTRRVAARLMRAVVSRVSHARVAVADAAVGEVGEPGPVVLVGVGATDEGTQRATRGRRVHERVGPPA